jgi:hypothetical protein
MATGARAHVLAAASGRRGFAWAPDWRAVLAGALAREVEERRFFLWIPVVAMAGVALNFAAGGEPVLWLPALTAAGLAALAWVCRARPLTRGMLIGAAALCAGFLSTGLRIARVETPMLDHIRIVKLQGFVEEVDFRPVGARLVVAVVDRGDMPANLAQRRVRVTTRKAPGVAAGDYVSLQARLLPPSRAVLPGGYDFARDADFAGVGANAAPPECKFQLTFTSRSTNAAMRQWIPLLRSSGWVAESVISNDNIPPPGITIRSSSNASKLDRGSGSPEPSFQCAIALQKAISDFYIYPHPQVKFITDQYTPFLDKCPRECVQIDMDY